MKQISVNEGKSIEASLAVMNRICLRNELKEGEAKVNRNGNRTDGRRRRQLSNQAGKRVNQN
jgi:hypothetical protein